MGGGSFLERKNGGRQLGRVLAGHFRLRAGRSDFGCGRLLWSGKHTKTQYPRRHAQWHNETLATNFSPLHQQNHVGWFVATLPCGATTIALGGQRTRNFRRKVWAEVCQWGRAVLSLGVAATVAWLTGCFGIHGRGTTTGAPERDLTVGVVQKEIHVGLSQAEVLERLGSPNIVTRDSAGNETWVYDKIATEASYSQSHAYGTILVLGGSRAGGTVRTTQHTLTVVIKFDANQKVESFSYHASKF